MGRHRTPKVAAEGADRALRAVGTTGLADRLGEILEETRRLEEEIRILEESLPVLSARREAAIRPLLDGIVEGRKALVDLVRRHGRARTRDRRFQREVQELLLHLASDLQERFGVDLHLDASGGVGGLEEDADEEFEGEDPFRDEAWARPESHRPRHAPDRVRTGRKPPVDPEAAARGIYRSLARELHPDKTRDEAERERRTGLMQSLTVAWQARDLPALLRLLHAHGSEDAREGAMDEASLEACLRGLQEDRDRLGARVRALRHRGVPGGATDWMPIVRDPALFEKLLRREKRPFREELEQVLRVRGWFATPEGLERFLREVPWEDWPAIL